MRDAYSDVQQLEDPTHRQWIGNGRRLAGIVAQMEKVSANAGELLLRQATSGSNG